MTYMVNRWMAKIDWKEVYNVRDLPRMGIEKKKGEKKGEDSSNSRDFGNLCNLLLKKEE